MFRLFRITVVNLLLIGLVAAIPATPASAAELDDYSWVMVNLKANDVAYDSVSGLLLVTVPGSDANYGDRLVAMDPASREIEWSLDVGMEPVAVEVSDDGSTAYVGIQEPFSVAKVDLASRTVVATFQLLVDPVKGAVAAEDIAIAPGQPDVIAVAMNSYPGADHYGVAIFDNGVPRPNVIRPPLNNNTGSNSIAFGASASVLYGQDTESSQAGFRRMTVDSEGVTLDDTTPMVQSPFVYLDGLIYYESGWVADPTGPTLLNNYATDRAIHALAPLPSLDRVLTLSGTTDLTTDLASLFDVDGYNLVDSGTFDHGEYLGERRGGVAIDGTGIAASYGERLLILGAFAEGTITGRVTDSTSGEAISEICVYATDEETYIFGQTETLDDGTYSMRVPPGSWRVLFGDCNYIDYFWEWHSNQVYFRFSNATPVTVTDNGTVTVNAALERSFADSVDDIFMEDIWWMRDTGITSGCRPEAYCPDQTVTRGQMAAFLVRALGLSATSGVDFVDDDGHIFELDIEKLATAGITKGCNPPTNDRFCPDQPVTRGQMAAFLVRALGLSATSGVDFVDDDGHIFELDIEKLATAGITKGCNPPTNDRFCPDQTVTRGQMAAFLHRALEDDYVLPLPASTVLEKVPSPSVIGALRPSTTS